MNKIEQFVKLFFQRVKQNTILLRSGYSIDQKGIQKRYHREKLNWDSHLKNSKQYILSVSNSLPKTKRVAILGSGWLNDVPYIQLSKLFEEVYLYDIIHPKNIQEKLKPYSNINLITADLTGGMLNYADNCKSFNEFALGLHNINPSFNFEAYDLVVSLNLLNQLDILLCDFLIKKFDVTNDELITIRKKIQSDHLNIMPPAKSCLITDYKELSINDKNEIIREKDLIYIDFPNYFDMSEWDWVFDTHNSYSNKFNTTFKVKAIRF